MPLRARRAPLRPSAPQRPHRINRQIRLSPIRVVGSDGAQLGVMDTADALAEAERLNLDLVEVAPEARPPVCRIMDYGKFKYDQAKQAKQTRKKQHVVELKEVKFRPGIGDHDFAVKAGNAKRFLEDGNKVKVTMQFRGRQITHPEIGRAVLDRLVTLIGEAGKIEQAPSFEGRHLIMVLGPNGRKH